MKRISTRAFALSFLVLALILAGAVSYYASSHPDGLEFVAGERGFLDTATDHAAAAFSPLADYTVEGIGNSRLAGGLAGIIGCGVVLLVVTGLSRLTRPHDGEDSSAGHEPSTAR